MRILESIEEFKTPRNTLVLTIGNFDGMHRGHCAVLNKVIELAGNEGQTVVITFRNHPSEILQPNSPTYLITSLPHKLLLLQNFPIDQAVLLTFSSAIAQRSAASFIESVRQFIPFTHLVLGYDATLGRDKQGNPTVLEALGEQWGFTTYYLEAYRFEGKPVSSSRIRDAIRGGDLEVAAILLNRPYSIYAPVQSQLEEDIFLDVSRLCLPPPGTYVITASANAIMREGLAIIESSRLLKLRLKEKCQLQNGTYLEIIFETVNKSAIA